jgi:hypothetical protein
LAIGLANTRSPYFCSTAVWGIGTDTGIGAAAGGGGAATGFILKISVDFDSLEKGNFDSLDNKESSRTYQGLVLGPRPLVRLVLGRQHLDSK